MQMIKSQQEFDALLKNDKKVVIDFYADWCGPCKMMAPFFEEVANETKEMVFAKLNVDELEEIAESFEITSIPTLIVFDRGKPVGRISGFLNKAKILELIGS